MQYIILKSGLRVDIRYLVSYGPVEELTDFVDPARAMLYGIFHRFISPVGNIEDSCTHTSYFETKELRDWALNQLDEGLKRINE